MIIALLLLALAAPELTACTPQVALQDGANMEAIEQSIKNGTMPPVAAGITCKLKE
jgi:hypothetical protein